MIAEWLTSLRISCTPHIRAMGFHKKLTGLAYRYKRVAPHWRSHQENTREVISAAIDACERKNTAVVLGAGALFDVPLEQLCQQFERVYLIDVVFLPSTRRAIRGYKNCWYINCDVTGTLERVYECAQQSQFSDLPKPADPIELAAINADLTLSVNILSQLPIVPMRYLERESQNVLSEDTSPLSDYCHKVIAHHLRWLQSLPGQVCLISDESMIYHREEKDKMEKVISKEDALFGNTLPPEGERWFWDISPTGEQAKDVGVRHTVYGNPNL